jgi:hypothetical protein
MQSPEVARDARRERILSETIKQLIRDFEELREEIERAIREESEAGS